MALFWKCLKYMPIIILIGVPLSIFITYGLAVYFDHVTPILPYVSDTGTIPPESCYFGFFLSTYSFILICAAYVRYRQVTESVKLDPNIKIKPSCNRAAFSIAVFSAVGLNIVAAFQEKNEFIIHFVGALMCFFGGTAYFIFQTVFTRRLSPEAKGLFYVRIVLTSLNIFCTISTFAPLHSASVNFKGDNVLKWTAEDGGYEFHLISTYAEWLLIYSFVAYMFTFHWDFMKFDLEPPAVIFKNLNAAPAGRIGENRLADRNQQTDKNQQANRNRETPKV